MKRISLFLSALLMTSLTFASLKTEKIAYKQGKANLEGFLVYDDAITGKRPGVLVVHEWYGLNDYARMRAEQLASMGYVAFAIDIYGKGVLAKDAKEAGELSAIYKNNRPLMRDRMTAAYQTFLNSPVLDATRVAAIGYCFGGTCALEFARSGAKVNGVVSFHGGLDTPNGADNQNIQTKVLVLHGADDPYVPMTAVAAFEEEMKKTKADWQVVLYSGAVHAFTNMAAGNDNSKGAAYNATADARSWAAMKNFFDEIFKK